MKKTKIYCRSGTIQGSKHHNLGVNNQDSFMLESFTIPGKKRYTIGLVSDGCTGKPAFTKSEVGSIISTRYAYSIIQNNIRRGVDIEEIPSLLYFALTNFLRLFAQQVMPSDTFWPFPMKFTRENDLGRNKWDSTTRFKIDYLSATLLGFISNEEEIIVFSAGDGIIVVDDTIESINQNDRPAYPVLAINNPNSNFVVRVFRQDNIKRLAISTDGLKKLFEEKDDFVESLFSQPKNMFGLQALLKRNMKDAPEFMEDDCTIVTLQQEVLEEQSDSNSTSETQSDEITHNSISSDFKIKEE